MRSAKIAALFALHSATTWSGSPYTPGPIQDHQVSGFNARASV